MHFLEANWLKKKYNIKYTATEIAKKFNVKPEKIRNRVYYLKKENHQFFKFGSRPKPKNFCPDCGKEIYRISNRCGSCSSKIVYQKRGNYINNHQGIKWTKKEIEYLKQHYEKGNSDKIAKKLNRSKISIIKKALRIGLNRDFDIYMQRLKESGALFSTKNNPMKDKEIKKKAKKKMKLFYEKHPEKLLNARLKRNRMTNIEKIMSQTLDSLNINYDWNKYVKTKSGWKFPDFRIIGTNILIECDGEYWHNKQKEQDSIRQKELEEVNFKVIRFSDKEIFKNIEGIKRCIQHELNQLKN